MLQLGIAYVGTGVLVPLFISVLPVVVQAVTATEEFIDDVDRLHQYVSRGSISRITATIHLLDAGHITTFDDDFGGLLANGWYVRCQVTAAIDCRHVIAMELLQLRNDF